MRGSQVDFQYSTKPMLNLLNPPKFSVHQQVQFIGGNGTILFSQPDGGHWLYGVEMPFGTESALGRIGHETIVLMSETELCIRQDLKRR